MTRAALALLLLAGCKDKAVDTGPDLVIEVGGSWSVVAAGGDFTCAINTDNAIECWGSDDSGAVSDAPTDTGWIELTAGGGFACARKADGVPTCWGADEDGQATPTGDPVLQISAGFDTACGLRADGYVSCWGNSELGATVPPADRFDFVSSGTGFSCGVNTKDAAICWGRDDLEADAADNPVNAAGGSYRSVAAGDGFACGAKKDGGATCWGDSSDWPDLFEEDEIYTQLSIAAGDACGVLDSGDAWCARLSEVGARLDGSYAQVSAGLQHGCALSSGGSLSCWAWADSATAAVSGP